MNQSTLDFQGIIKLDRQVADQLSAYLDEKESALGHSIIDSIDTSLASMPSPEIPATQYKVKLSEAVEVFGKRIRELSHQDQSLNGELVWQHVRDKVNQGFWQYLELIEDCATELFQQLNQLGLEHWKPSLSHTLESIKMHLMHRMDDLHWAIRRMEKQLWQLRWICERKAGHSTVWDKATAFFRSLLDRSLITNLQKSQKYLAFNYKKFVDRYSEYQYLNEKIDQSVQKFSTYKVLNTFDDPEIDKYKKIYQLLKLWDLNRKAKAIPQMEVVKALRNVVAPARALGLFKEYYGNLRTDLFEKSRSLKARAEELTSDLTAKKAMNHSIDDCRSELATLAATIARYREFLLRTDPNPYVRSRWGFSEWIVGPEPLQTRELLKLGYDAENLDAHYGTLKQAMLHGPQTSDTLKLAHAQQETQKLLHEMTQPLVSSTTMRSNAEKIVKELDQLNELGSFSPSVVNLVEQTLSKALRADWKYHVLFDFPQFTKIYQTHLGIQGETADERKHLNRLNKFKRMTQQILDWVKAKSSLKHIHEIELDMSDIKGYLQDFLAYVQRICKEENLSQEHLEKLAQDISHQLLQYRYIFGKFFHELRESEPEERLVRNQFLFVDQYFETVDTTLQSRLAMKPPENEEGQSEESGPSETSEES